MADRLPPPGGRRSPLVPYHDARTLLVAAGRPAPVTTADGIRAVSQWSLAELARREAEAGALTVSELVLAAGAGAAHTVNHPGNALIVGLARRAEAGFGWPVSAGDPGRTLLDSVHAPVEAPVRAALGLPPAGGSEHHTDWVVGGRVVSAAEVRAVQLGWYEQHPAVVARLLARSADQLLLLGATGLPG
nr:WcbI family polysaccharide biosynthesis putative acetyltransferase [Humibacillus sp. DSM 29435]